MFVESRDITLPRLGLFALREIDAGEELTFDYTAGVESVETGPASANGSGGEAGGGDGARRLMFVCQCGAPNCRKYIYVKDHTTDEESAAEPKVDMRTWVVTGTICDFAFLLFSYSYCLQAYNL